MGKRQRRRTVSFRPDVFHALADIAKARGLPVARLVDHIACSELKRHGFGIAPFEGRPPAAKPRVRKPSPRKPPADPFPGLATVRPRRISDAPVQDHGAYMEL